MEEEKQLAGEDRLSGEIVEVYRQPLPGEVVERYSRPLPGRPAAPGQPRRRRRTGLWIFLACLAVVLGVAAGSWIWYLLPAGSSADPFEYRYDHGWEEEEDASGAVTIPTYPFGEGAVLEVETDHGRELTAQEIYQRVNPSVVTVMVQLDDSVSVGTGVIFRADGYILTNYHVLAGGRDCTVAMDTGRTYEAQYVAGDERNDLAVLKVELTGLPAATFGDSDQLVVGDKVYAIGNPLGVELRGTLTDGIVSAINRDVQVDGRTMTLVQTNAALNSGNSGGPLFNEYGQVIGIVSAKLSSSSNSEASVEGLGFAIPINDVKDMVTSIIEHGYVTGKPNVGILMKDVPQEAQQYGVPAGSEVLAVLDGSGAGKAGLQAGDIITAVNGTAVSGSEALKAAVQDCKAGDKVTFSVYRDGDTVELEITLDEDNQTTQEAMEQLQKDYQEQQAQQEQQQPQQNGGYFPWPFGW